MAMDAVGSELNQTVQVLIELWPQRRNPLGRLDNNPDRGLPQTRLMGGPTGLLHLTRCRHRPCWASLETVMRGT